MQHLFFSCPFAASIWERAPISERPMAHATSFAAFLMDGIKAISLPPVGLRIPLGPWLCWNIWKARNKLLFDGKLFTGHEVLLKAIKDAREWQEAQIETPLSPPSSDQAPRRSHDPTPVAPLSGPTCHVDAAWNPITEVCGIGGVFHGVSPQVIKPSPSPAGLSPQL